jgi:thiol-disulfide isomerase/thioredoxin
MKETMTNLTRLALAVLLAAVLTGCGGSEPAAARKPDTTSALPDTGVCAECTGSDSVGAVCESLVDTSVAVAANEPDPMPEPAVAEEEALPKLWDFGSTTCLPCKTMKAILDPMIADYRGKVEVRIVDVYQEKELTRQFRVSVIPTQIFLDAQGKELRRHMGVYPRDSIEACFKEFGFPVVTGAKSPTPPPAFGST